MHFENGAITQKMGSREDHLSLVSTLEHMFVLDAKRWCEDAENVVACTQAQAYPLLYMLLQHGDVAFLMDDNLSEEQWDRVRDKVMEHNRVLLVLSGTKEAPRTDPDSTDVIGEMFGGVHE